MNDALGHPRRPGRIEDVDRVIEWKSFEGKGGSLVTVEELVERCDSVWHRDARLRDADDHIQRR